MASDLTCYNCEPHWTDEKWLCAKCSQEWKFDKRGRMVWIGHESRTPDGDGAQSAAVTAQADRLASDSRQVGSEPADSPQPTKPDLSSALYDQKLYHSMCDRLWEALPDIRGPQDKTCDQIVVDRLHKTEAKLSSLLARVQALKKPTLERTGENAVNALWNDAYNNAIDDVVALLREEK